MQENRYTESDEHKGEQHGRQRPAIKTRHERSREECDGCEENENRTGAQPALRLGPRDLCVRSLHRVTAGGDTDPPGPSETPARQKASGVFRSNTFTILAGCYAQKRGESICPELSGSTTPLQRSIFFCASPRCPFDKCTYRCVVSRSACPISLATLSTSMPASMARVP